MSKFLFILSVALLVSGSATAGSKYVVVYETTPPIPTACSNACDERGFCTLLSCLTAGTESYEHTKTFDSAEALANWLMQDHYEAADVQKIIDLKTGEFVEWETWETTREVPQERVVESYTERTQHVKIGKQEFNGEPTGKPWGCSDWETVGDTSAISEEANERD
jgi:hypothetical protein